MDKTKEPFSGLEAMDRTVARWELSEHLTSKGMFILFCKEAAKLPNEFTSDVMCQENKILANSYFTIMAIDTIYGEGADRSAHVEIDWRAVDKKKGEMLPSLEKEYATKDPEFVSALSKLFASPDQQNKE